MTVAEIRVWWMLEVRHIIYLKNSFFWIDSRFSSVKHEEEGGDYDIT
jgi:hypothetical protein